MPAFYWFKLSITALSEKSLIFIRLYESRQCKRCLYYKKSLLQGRRWALRRETERSDEVSCFITSKIIAINSSSVILKQVFVCHLLPQEKAFLLEFCFFIFVFCILHFEFCILHSAFKYKRLPPRSACPFWRAIADRCR